MRTEHFNLDCGRSVSVQKVFIENTYGGVLEGEPLSISRHIWQRTPADLQRRFGDHVVILKPTEPLLPAYRIVVELDSSPLPDEARWRHSGIAATLPFGFAWDCSFVRLCWFQHHLDGSLMDIIRQGAKGLDWEAHAKNHVE